MVGFAPWTPCLIWARGRERWRPVKALQRVLESILGQQLTQMVTSTVRQLAGIHRLPPRSATTSRRGLLTHLLHDDSGPFPAASRVEIAASPYGLRTEPDPATQAESVTRTSHRSSDRTELVAEIAGTRGAWITTQQTTGHAAALHTGIGTRVCGREFIIHPDEIKRLDVGEPVPRRALAKIARILHPSERWGKGRRC